MKKTRVLYISQEITPFLPKSEVSEISRNLPQGVHEKGKEIRVFMPRYGCINERRHQLHEVIRLSGMNLVVNDTDHPLIIKVASIPTARMQVYFIDNDDYFGRKAALKDSKGQNFKDNDERSIFFCRGVLETVKKLGWAPDVIHCHGWFTALVPLYIKKLFHDDPHFADAKVVYSAYNNEFSGNLDEKFQSKLEFDGIAKDDLKLLETPNFVNLNKLAMQYSDGVIAGSAELNPELEAYLKDIDASKLEYCDPASYVKSYNEFYDAVLEQNSVLAD